MKPKKRFSELVENTWAVYSTGTIDTNQLCSTKNLIKPRQVKSSYTISIDQRCYIQTMHHVISADESKTLEIEMKTIDRAGNL